MMRIKKQVTVIGTLLIIFYGCHTKEKNEMTRESTDTGSSEFLPQPYVELEHPEWTKNAVIYEVNIRQFSPEGSFRAFEAHLPRLKAMGIDILWLMPIHPIGEVNRKGELGSYYSVRDYYGVNPEFGTLEEFKSLVNKIHEMGMYVILDWVANHSAWDNSLVREHPDWYIKNREGNFQSTPWRDYDDIIDFDYNQPGLREYMTNALTYWVKETNIDGYRCDVASFVPIDFWEHARKELDAIKPVFMLAEAADRDLHKKAFDMTYSWALWDHLHAITSKGQKIFGLTEGYIAEHVSIWPQNGYRMNFTDNHDKNSWEGTQYSNFSDGLQTVIILTATMDGMPMVYSGQEAGLDRSLDFFNRDPIEWRAHENEELFTKLFALKHQNEALWNGEWGGPMIRIKNNSMDHVISFTRERSGDKVLVVSNLSGNPTTVTLESSYDAGSYHNILDGGTYELTAEHTLEMEPWSSLVLSTSKPEFEVQGD